MSQDGVQINHSSKCDGCFYKVKWGAGDLAMCNRDWNMTFEESKEVCESPGPCKYFITPEEVNRLLKTWIQNPN